MPTNYAFRKPRNNEVGTPHRSEARFLRAIVRERGYWLSPLLADLPMPPDRLASDDVEPVAERLVGPHHRGPRVAALPVEAVEEVEVEVVAPTPPPPPPPPILASAKAIKGGTVVLRPVDPAKAAEAIARIAQVAKEKADEDAERKRLEDAKVNAEVEKAARRKEQCRRASKKNREKRAAEETLVAQLVEERKLKARVNNRNRDRKRREEANLVASLPTAKELVDEARLAEIVERVNRRKAKRREREALRVPRRREERRQKRLADLRAKAEQPGQAAERLATDPQLAKWWKQYLDHRVKNSIRYHTRKGIDLPENLIAFRWKEAETTLLARLDAEPDFLHKWAEKREKIQRKSAERFYERLREDPERWATYNQKRLDYYHRTKKGGDPTGSSSLPDGSTDR